MHYSVCVSVVHGFGERGHEGGRLLPGNRFCARFEPSVQVGALAVSRGDITNWPHLSRIIDRHQIGVIQDRRRALRARTVRAAPGLTPPRRAGP